MTGHVPAPSMDTSDSDRRICCKRGEDMWRMKSEILGQVCIDRRPVHFLSSIHPPEHDAALLGADKTRDRTNLLDSLNDQQLLERYRFRRNDIMWLSDKFGAELEHRNQRKGVVPAYMQVMVALRVFATGAFQLDVGDTFGITKPTVCRIVSSAVSATMNEYVKFDNALEAETTKLAF